MDEIKKTTSSKILALLGKERFLLAIIFFLALSLRLLHVFHVSDIAPFGDAMEYHAYGVDMANYQRFGIVQPSTYRGPVYPFFLGVIYMLYGQNYQMARIIQAILGSAMCLVMYFLGKKLFSRAVGYFAAIITATFSLYIFYSACLLTETLYLFLIASIALLFLNVLKEPTTKNLISTGLLIGVSALLRAEILLTSVLLVGILWIENKFKILKTAREASIILAAVLIIILPWTFRNFVHTHRLVLISSQGGENFWKGNNPKSIGWQMRVSEDIANKYTTQIDMDKGLMKEALVFIKHNPTKWLKLLKVKFLAAFQFWRDEDQWLFPKRFGFISGISPPLFTMSAIVLLCFIGLLLNIRHTKALFIFYAFFITNLLLQTLLFVEARFHMHITPFMIILAASVIFFIEENVIKRFFPKFYDLYNAHREFILYPQDAKKPRRKKTILPTKSIKNFISHHTIMVFFIVILCLIIPFITLKIKNNIESTYTKKTKDLIVVQGENPKTSNYHIAQGFVPNNSQLLGNKALELQTNKEIPGGYFAIYAFDVNKEDTYDIYIAGTAPGTDTSGDNSWFSPYSISIDGAEPKEFTEESIQEDWPFYKKYQYIEGGYFFIKLMNITLNEGAHEIKVVIDKRRKHDGNFTFFIDALVISPESFKPKYNIGKIRKEIFYEQ